MPINPKKMIKLLKSNGFIVVRQKGSHIIMVNPITNMRTIVPMHNHDLPIGTERAILKQAGIKNENK
ncbi:MAG: type II toxin-antitoxin system HicA family toxin [Mycoplasmataceae bacterium]|jgi:predicted RNA binding protein YcfA (HicA-like mRNA interferase family)|nr:type II toxin-antitoxin system HicA family toxin [Mycoplasmataceae bacterium]